MKLLRVSVLGLACVLPVLSFAQWQWIDKDGRKVFSDQSPPADIPVKNIIKQPGVKGPAAADPLAAAASQPAKPAPATPKLSGKDQELQEKRRKRKGMSLEKDPC